MVKITKESLQSLTIHKPTLVSPTRRVLRFLAWRFSRIQTMYTNIPTKAIL